LAQSQSTGPDDALEVSEWHLDAFALAAGLLEGRSSGERSRHLAGRPR
jgi:hypothetical protein